MIMKRISKEHYEVPQVSVMQIGSDSCILNGSGNVVVGPSPEYPD